MVPLAIHCIEAVRESQCRTCSRVGETEMDKPSAMRAFVRGVECGSFTKAAETLGWPKPTVSRWVQWVEGELKVVLLNRTARRVAVTPDGAAYFERATRILAEVDDLEAGLSSERAMPSGQLRVDVGSAVAQ